MKHIFLLTIFIYQKFISVFLKNILGVSAMCRFSPSCSAYAKQAISRHGVLRGGSMSLMRIISCQPFFNK